MSHFIINVIDDRRLSAIKRGYPVQVTGMYMYLNENFNVLHESCCAVFEDRSSWYVHNGNIFFKSISDAVLAIIQSTNPVFKASKSARFYMSKTEILLIDHLYNLNDRIEELKSKDIVKQHLINKLNQEVLTSRIKSLVSRSHEKTI